MGAEDLPLRLWANRYIERRGAHGRGFVIETPLTESPYAGWALALDGSGVAAVVAEVYTLNPNPNPNPKP